MYVTFSSSSSDLGIYLKVREVDDFQSLRENWNYLLRRNLLGNNVFLTWEWLFTWWKHFGKGRKLLILTVEDKAGIIAIAPLMLSKYKLPVLGTITKVEFLGARHSDYNNFIILKKEAKCLNLMINHLMGKVTGWDWIELKEIPQTTENAAHLERLFLEIPTRIKLSKRVCNLCPYMPLPRSFDALLAELRKNMRQNLNKYLRRIKAKHRVEFKKYDEAGFSVEEAMRTFIKLHEARWTAKGKHGAFGSNPIFRDFHMEIAKIFESKGWLGLYFLMADGEPITTQYTFEYDGKVYYYLSGFNPEYSPYSVGNLTIMFLLERAIKNGYREYDMMRGFEPYKRLWASQYRKNFEVRLIRDNILSRFYNWLIWSKISENLASKLKLSLKNKAFK